MKTLLTVEKTIVYLAFLTATVCLAQPATSTNREPKTKLGSFQAKTGSVIIKGMQKVGKVESDLGSIVIECREFIDASNSAKAFGITIEVVGFSTGAISLVDYDEIDSLVKGIDYVSKVNKSATDLDKFEAIFTTKDDLRISTFWDDKAAAVRAAISNGYGHESTAYFNLEQLNEVRALILKAKEKLDTIKK